MKNSKSPLVSVIIVNWNGGEIFNNCLKSLSKLTYSSWELIVVDNASSDSSENLPKKFKKPLSDYSLIKNQYNVGFAPANNQGFKNAKGEYVLLLNNDTEVTPFFLSKLVAKMESDKSIGVLQPKIYMMDKPNHLDNAGSFMTWTGFLKHWGFGEKDRSEFSKEREVFSAKGACMLIRRKVIEKVGLFDDDFNSYFEESDFCWRVWLAGWKVIYFPKTHIYHKVGFTIKRLDVKKINFDYYKNRIASLIKNLNPLNLVLILPIHIILSIGIALLFAVRKQTHGAKLILSAIAWNVITIRTTLNKRHRVQKIRIVSDKELFKNLKQPVNFIKFYKDFKRVEKDIS